MQTRVAVIAIMVEDQNSVSLLQNLLSECAEYIIGRMGIPYKQRNVNVISVVIDAPVDKINTLTGKIGKLDGVNAKTVFSNV
ncbi:MAG: TM1266 family iron-only hydrogenase system putative regulator [Acutalibacteraceae bacterium]|nr:TM1266 family iron-only hydrogenase system putative regulator [Acutalibacteraceae bacterium]